jgi:glycerol uptake facilitator-like aquaporin
MIPLSLARRAIAEALGSAFLLATVVGSGIMAERLAGGIAGLALLCNALATGAMLAVLIIILGPISGAHLNPAVSLASAWRKELSRPDAAVYIASQIIGAVLGVWLAHLMFDLPMLQAATAGRRGFGQWLAEAIATFGLLLTIIGCRRHEQTVTPFAVGLYIFAAYWFTASTSFANPAVTLARSLSDTFTGIAPADVRAFILAQLSGMAAAVAVGRCLWQSPPVLGKGR